ncbi:MAG TPA: hypothetical protein VHE14_01090 [Solirubrobacteraceae bacterium]|nr:hypothetical protein [Solirubrobacteraceae bacterium]
MRRTAVGLAVALSATVVTPTALARRSATPRVGVMVAGRSALLYPPATVSARSTTLRVGGRRCAVAAGTSLAALDAFRRAGGPSFVLRDYGRCSARARDSSSLFVSQIGAEANSGQDGWVYKVDGKLATTGAANTAGPFGDRRALRSGQRVLWFYCLMSSAGACQPTLSLSLSADRVPAAAMLSVKVSAEDDQGNAQPANGATVTLGSATAMTVDGVATLSAPAAAGTYQVNASAAGAVQAFPQELTVT